MMSNAFALTDQMYFISDAFISGHFLPTRQTRRRKRLSSRLAVFAIKRSSIAIIADNSGSLFERTVALEYRVSNIYCVYSGLTNQKNSEQEIKNI